MDNKGVFMQKVSYMGDGVTTEFFFNFPFFENSNVVVTINNTAATGYSIIRTPGGLDPDIPYIGGKVVFEVAPTSIDCITIAADHLSFFCMKYFHSFSLGNVSKFPNFKSHSWGSKGSKAAPG